MAEEVRLFKTWSSPYGLRIVWALKLKGIQYDSVDEDLTNKSSLLLQYNPVHKKVSVLVHNGKPIAESLVILEYIEKTWKQYPLLPEDPQERAAARFWAKIGDDKQAFTMGKAEEVFFVPAIENLKFLQEQLKGKKFFGGDGIGFVDIALVWLAYLVPIMEKLHGRKLIDGERFPLLSAGMQEFSKVPEIAATMPPHDKLIAKFRAYLS